MSLFSFARAQIRSIRQRDPSVKSSFEILFFPGFRAMNTWYITHKLYKNGHCTLARILSLKAQRKTGIDIHPGAVIGDNFFIDHGAGVVIGETTIIGNNCTLFQGVTLGATGHESGLRHPILEDNVIIGAGAKVIGRITIGKNSRIGAGSVIVKSVPAYTTMIPPAAHPIRYKDFRIPQLSLEAVNRRLSEDIRQTRLKQSRLATEISQLRCALPHTKDLS